MARSSRGPTCWVLLGLLGGVGLGRVAAAQEPSSGASPHGKLALSCTTCHSSDAWRPVRFSPAFRHADFGFALAEGHGAVTCTSCHKSLEFSKVDKTCASCHRDVHQGELGLDCARCHNTRDFRDRAPQVQAHALTRFPLEGAHRALDCASCHTGRSGTSLVFRGAPTQCIGCHRADFERTSRPNHPAAGFPADCTGCHGNTSWQTSAFDHNATRFPLSGAHLATTCQACHSDGVYHNKPTACVSCHQNRYNATTSPPHQASGIATNCEGCHNTATWGEGGFNHANTQFPLTGAHLATGCQACHLNGVYKGIPLTCVGCHQNLYGATTNPPHQAAGFSTDCTTCHTTVTWTGGGFNHSATQFPLTGAHLAVTCQQCHGDGVYKGKPTTCVSCHQSTYTGTTNPPHQAAGFPTDCTTCHNTVTWTGATFNHSATQFPLTGAHLTVACNQCHGDGVYDGKPTTCISCHQADYTGTTNPSHLAAGFPTSCTSCHTTTTWSGATFNHDSWFRIYSGKHKEKWNTCADCHANPASYAQFTCLTCHNKTKMDEEHKNKAGYSYSSPACYSCHKGV